MTNRELIHHRLTQAFPQAAIHVFSPRGDDDHLAVTITCPSFTGKSRIACHKMVYQALDGLVGGQVHALSITTLAPETSAL